MPGRRRALARLGPPPPRGVLWALDGTPPRGQPALQALPSDLSASDGNEARRTGRAVFFWVPLADFCLSPFSASRQPSLLYPPDEPIPPARPSLLQTQPWLPGSLQRNQTAPLRPLQPPRGPAKPAGCAPPQGLWTHPPLCLDHVWLPFPSLTSDGTTCHVTSGLAMSSLASVQPGPLSISETSFKEKEMQRFRGGQGPGPPRPVDGVGGRLGPPPPWRGRRRKVTPCRSGEAGGVDQGHPAGPGCPPAQAVTRPTLAGTHGPAEAGGGAAGSREGDQETPSQPFWPVEKLRVGGRSRLPRTRTKSLGGHGSSLRGFSRVPQAPRAACGPAPSLRASALREGLTPRTRAAQRVF